MNVENVTKLRDHLVNLKEMTNSKLFKMEEYICSANDDSKLGPITPKHLKEHKCKTAACLAGWSFYLYRNSELSLDDVMSTSNTYIISMATFWLELEADEAIKWFHGKWSRKDLPNITIDDAIKFLNRQLEKAKKDVR